MTEKNKQLFCFIIMPFTYLEFTDNQGNKIAIAEKELDYLYKNFFKKALEAYDIGEVKINARRYSSKSGNFMKGIVNDLFRADLVMADITGLNPNVMYELGIRHTLKDNTIMIAQDKNQIPSDLAHYITVFYSYSKSIAEIDSLYEEFKSNLHEAIKEKLANWNRADNPVRDFIEIKNEFKNEERIKELIGNLNIFSFFNQNILGVIYSVKKTISDWHNAIDNGLPYIHSDWSEFYFPLLKSPQDAKIGEYIMNISDNLKMITNNLKGIRDILLHSKNKDFNRFHCGLPLRNGKFISIGDFDDSYEPIKSDLIAINNEWENELLKLKG